ncbi:hypothetical protein FZC84_13040 [Rossellomorea vietnamensis]|uniref:Glycosyltransferase RgtA/B/C/D-like domain-containing protein n=1 Tax=Rossellomorea vietnamensis TaxID=218284 RepID=A0A5D4MCA1_9BACI|nr:DUF6020 family protein [Rossellomorea vietnamensis]TYR98943.1 hypothetical protein FZC84_13040 [Rossellomorea vietnamensis]
MNNIVKYLGILFVSGILTASTVFFFYPIRNASPLYSILAFILIAAVTFVYFKWRPFLRSSSIESAKYNKWVLTVEALFSVFLLFSVKGEQIFLADNSLVIVALVYLFTFLFIFMLVNVVITSLLNIEFNTYQRDRSSFVRFLVYFIPVLGAMLIYWIAFFPAAMTPDSLAQWEQAHTRDFNDWHPIVFTWTIMLLTFIWDSPGIVSLFQMISMSVVFAYMMLQFERIGVKRIFLYSVTLLFMILPVTGIFPLIIWKDILFSAFVLLFSTHVFNIVYTKGEWLKGPWSMAGFLLSSFGLVFFRHNGFPVFIIVGLCLLIVYRKHIKYLLPAYVGIIALHFVITGPVFNALDVEPSDPNEALSLPTQQIALIVSEDGEMTEEQRNYVNDILPIQMWKDKYNPYLVDPIKFSWEDYDRELIFDDFGRYVKNWLALWWQNPALGFEAFFDQTSLVWQINQPEDGYTDSYVTNIYYGNPQGLVDKVIHPAVTSAAGQYLQQTKDTFGFIIWRPAVYFSLIALFSMVVIIRNGFRYVLVSLPVLLNILAVMAALPAQDFRYLFSNTLITFLLFVMIFINDKKTEGVLDE